MELKQPCLSVVIFVWIPLAVNHVEGNIDGAPNDRTSCNTLLPTHSTGEETTEMPYVVMVDDLPNSGNYDVTHNHTGRCRLTI